MRSKISKRIQSEAPKDSKIYAKHYADIVIRINELLKRKNFSQKDLAEKMEKRQSEISRWLSGEHNFTIRSISKLEAELDDVILNVPKSKKVSIQEGKSYYITMSVNNHRHNLNLMDDDAAKGKAEEDSYENEFYQYEKIGAK